MNPLGFLELKVVALAASDLPRAENFYRNTLGLAPAMEGLRPVGFKLGNLVVMLKATSDDWPARPSAELNPRLTVAVSDAPYAEKALRALGVTVSDPVLAYPDEGYCVGAFLDSEGNKLWFCSLLPDAIPA